MKQAFLRSIDFLSALPAPPWKWLLLAGLFLFPALALFGEDFSQVEGMQASLLLDAVPGPVPSIVPEQAAGQIKNVRNPPAEAKPPRETEAEAALKKRARRAAERYTLSNKTLFQHILARHGPEATVPGKSRFVKGFDVSDGIDYVLKSPDARIRANTDAVESGSAPRGRRGYIFEVTYRTRIGTSPEKKPLKTMRVVIDEAGHVITAFPVK